MLPGRVLLLLVLTIAAFLGETAARAASADISVALLDFPDPVAVGEELHYAINVENHGPDYAGPVTVTFPPQRNVEIAQALCA